MLLDFALETRIKLSILNLALATEGQLTSLEINFAYSVLTPLTLPVSGELPLFIRLDNQIGGDIWRASIDPVVDLNADGIVDAVDLCIVVDNWMTDDPLCDVGPMSRGDGIVDV